MRSKRAFVYENVLLFTMAQRSAAEARWARVGAVGRQGSALYITRYPRELLPRPDPVIPPLSRCCEISPFRGAKGGAEITKHTRCAHRSLLQIRSLLYREQSAFRRGGCLGVSRVSRVKHLTK